MISDESYAKGWQMLQRMCGEQAEAVRRRFAELSPDFERYVLGFLAGEMWARPGLDLKTRSLCTIAALTALGRPSALELNTRMALNNGATREEIMEVLLHTAAYAGFPACWEGLVVAQKVFAEKDT